MNVSIHSGGGPCIDPPANSLGIVTWQRTVTSDANGTSSTSSVKMEFLQAPNILGFERPPVVSVSSVGSYGFLRLPPAVCPASYPTTLDAGAIALSGPDFGPLSLQPQNQKGLVGYQASLPDTAGQGGEYLVTARGGPAVGAFSAEATLPPPITITNDLRPGTSIRLPFTLSWTGGDSDSVVTVQLIAHIPGQATPLLFATSLASDGTRPLPLPPAEVPYSFPLHTEVEIIVTQQPAKVPSRPFSAAGLTLGGEQTWKYVFDFKALRSQ